MQYAYKNVARVTRLIRLRCPQDCIGGFGGVLEDAQHPQKNFWHPLAKVEHPQKIFENPQKIKENSKMQ